MLVCVKGAISQKNPDQSCGGFTHLFDSDADSDRVDRSLNKNLLLVITTDDHRLEQQLFTAPVTTTPFSHRENPGLLTFKLSDPADFCKIRLQNRMWQVCTGQFYSLAHTCFVFLASFSVPTFSKIVGTGTARWL